MGVLKYKVFFKYLIVADMTRDEAEKIVDYSINIMRLKAGYTMPTPEEREIMIKKIINRNNYGRYNNV